MIPTMGVIADPEMVRRQNELFELHNQWPGDDDPDDDSEFVDAAREIMGLPPLEGDEGEARAQQDHDSLRLRGIVDDDELRAAGRDVTPGHDELHHYWVYGKGRGKWKTWTELVAHLTRHVGPLKAKTFASRWFYERYGYYSGSDINRVKHGKPPRGDRIGPG